MWSTRPGTGGLTPGPGRAVFRVESTRPAVPGRAYGGVMMFADYHRTKGGASMLGVPLGEPGPFGTYEYEEEGVEPQEDDEGGPVTDRFTHPGDQFGG